MCIQNTTSHDYDCSLPSGSVHVAPISDRNARNGERINWSYTHTPAHTRFISPDATSSSVSASLPAFSAIDQFFEAVEDSIYTQQPPPHVINFWFDRLGLSLDPTPWGNPSNSAGFLPRLPPLDGNDCVSVFLVILCCVTLFRSPYDLG